jgi:hypothetical protein
MSSHYHLLVQTPAGNLSRAIRHLNGVYTQRYNRRRDTDGQLFRGRYKSVLVEEDSHLLELLRYIHRNPVRAQMCKSVDEYPWSSHQGYISGAKKWDWLSREFLLGMFADTPVKARREYLKFVLREDSPEVTGFFGKKNLASVFGSPEFLDWVKEKFFQVKRHREIPQSRQLAPTIAEIKKAVCLSYGIEVHVLEHAKRGRMNEPRNVAIYLARTWSGLPLDEIGKGFGLEKYSSVSSIVGRAEKRLVLNKELRKTVAAVRRSIEKSQAKT